MIGLLGGTFDPIHFGHLNLAIELKEKCNLKQVWIIPAHTSPFRQQEKITAAKHRLKMAQLAAQHIPDIEVVDIEMRRAPPSYTIDTIKEIYIDHPEIALLLGEDAALQFPQWKDARQIVGMCKLLIGSRKIPLCAERIQKFILDKEIREACMEGIRATCLMDIEANVVRKRLKNNQYCGHLVPSNVLEYICENQLYFKDCDS